MILYVVYNFKKLVLYEDDKNYVEYELINLDKFGPVNITDTSLFIFFNIYK